jgi:predicted ArsR family transcriptional regulator
MVLSSWTGPPDENFYCSVDSTPMVDLQVQARALGDPTRYEIFRYAADAAGPVGVAELTEHLGVNHNAVRQHLAKLVDAGLVVESTAASTGRGRPRLEYRVDPAADGRWGVAGPFERLALLLTEVVRTGDTPVEVGRRAGRRLRLGDEPADEPVGEFVEQMARQGFDPAVRQTGDSVVVTLEACPFASAVLNDVDTVCGLHLGLAQGLADAVGGLAVDDLEPKDPRRAHCRLRCHLTDA